MVGVFCFIMYLYIKIVMPNILNEELGRMKSLFSYQKGKVISEQVDKKSYSSPEEEIFYTLARAVSGAGTNIERLKQAFGLFKDRAQLIAVDKMMQTRPIGEYKNIASLLRGELETDNGKDFTEIQKIAQTKGIILKGTISNKNGQLDYRTITVSVAADPANNPKVSSGDTTSTGSTVINKQKVVPKKVAPPKEMGKITDFQDWLDGNKSDAKLGAGKGWATGYNGGVINQGKNGGGYGAYGPRTQKAWTAYGREYMTKDIGALANKGKEAADQEIGQEFTQQNPQ
jgi:hypothetical protein